jgi:hypothetical protein
LEGNGNIFRKEVRTWKDIAGYLKVIPDGTLPLLVISGHGCSGGAGGANSTKGGFNGLTLQADPESAAMIRSKLRPNAKLVYLACQAGANLADMLQTSEILGIPVIGNTGSVSGAIGNHKGGVWQEAIHNKHTERLRVISRRTR